MGFIPKKIMDPATVSEMASSHVNRQFLVEHSLDQFEEIGKDFSIVASLT
jgi:hypothetical protein